MKLSPLLSCSILFLTIALSSCGGDSSGKKENGKVNEINEREFTAEPDADWTNLFLRKSGWFGGDGIFVIPLSGKDAEKSDSLLFLFSDTMVGEIHGDSLQPGFVMINNSVALLKGKTADSSNMAFKMAGVKGSYKAIFSPKTNKPDKDTYFWLGDGFANPDSKNDLFIFAYQITNTHDKSPFPFKETDNVLIRIPAGSPFPYADQEQTALPFNDYKSGTETISFGAGVFNNSESAGEPEPDGFLYVYGIKGKSKQLVSARVKPAQVASFGDWEFWGGNGWSKDVKSVKALSDSVSNEMSVSRLSKGKYALVYQLGSIFPEICMQVGPTPVGPFGPRIVLYKTSNDIQDADLFTYNAKAHPALSAPGELLISYNVNSFKFFDVITKKPNLYRPRFVRVKFTQQSSQTNH
ncbi:DUF4185 domain-containing protein [Dyadobacter fanqingshengii]|uniref:DUF4185 domain-containing protein n=1 Tax=Dyadobacter fanqingshengii TaxID=2906443 RepID=UPI0020784BC2|nr:DUF4185 domain-containing protein [Dyadobacter fanqingshengii]USJ36806.1 DUF4185 domain-containing protein [Dyadobacter fanqingshengii]